MTRHQLDKAEAKDFALGGKPMRPRDAATLIVLERRNGIHHVLLGRRHERHAFMPGKFVFPGGRTDPADGRVAIDNGLHPDVEEKLVGGTGKRLTPTRARAIAMSALRETYEEAGLLIGRKGSFSTSKPDWKAFVEHEIVPSLEGLRLLARAITPPGRVRRYDTRFLAVFATNIALRLPGGGPSDELEELVWLPIEAARRADIPAITRTILGELIDRLEHDPELSPAGPVPFYRMINNRFRRDLL